jgi:hypothetical protein
VTTHAALEWARQPAVGLESNVWSSRMMLVRGFARYLSGMIRPPRSH